MQLAIALLVLVAIPTVLAWRAWMKADHSAVASGRKTAFLAGLLVTTAALALFAAFVAYTTSIGGFKTDFRSLLRWTRWGFWLSVAGVALCLAGRGRSRVWAALGALLSCILWIIPDWGM